MAITYRATPAITSSGSSQVTQLAVPKQAGTVAGDLIVMYAWGNPTGTLACTGFTAIKDASSFGGVLYRTADGSEGTTFTVTGFATKAALVIIVTLAGGSAFDPAVFPTPTAGGAATSLSIGGITLAGATDLVLWFCVDQATGFTGNGQTITPPAGFTSRVTNGPGPLTGAPVGLMADNASLGSGATGAKAGTAGAAAFFSGVMVGVTPAAGAVSGTASRPVTATVSAAGSVTKLGQATRPVTATVSAAGSVTFLGQASVPVTASVAADGLAVSVLGGDVSLAWTAAVSAWGSVPFAATAIRVYPRTYSWAYQQVSQGAAVTATATVSAAGSVTKLGRASGRSPPRSARPGRSPSSVRPRGLSAPR